MPGPYIRLFFLSALVVLIVGCAQEPAPSEPALATLTGRAVLPADSFSDGPAVGDALDPVIYGRNLPFE